MKEFEKRLRREIDEIKIVDTHEHIEPEEERIKKKIDFFHWFSHYASSDLVSAGMPPEVLNECRNVNKPLEERWQKFAPYWECIRTTSYGKALMLAAKDLYGVNDINQKTYIKLSQKISGANKKGLYKSVLKDKAGIEISLHPQDVNYFNLLDRKFFVPVIYIDGLVGIWNRDNIRALEKGFEREIHSIESIIEIMESAIDRAKKEGAVGAKCGLAYTRILKFDEVESDIAETVFEKIAKGEQVDAKPLQDFLMHRMLEILVRCGMPLQIHTGIQEGNGNFIINSNPAHLTNLFFKYPVLRFDIFHAGYPYSSELAVLAKNFANVYADMCWMYVITPTVSKRVLHEWIDTIPNNKIFGFGGDYIFVEGAYAHSVFAREVIYQVLIEKYKHGYLGQKECIILARKLLRINAGEFFGIKD